MIIHENTQLEVRLPEVVGRPLMLAGTPRVIMVGLIRAEVEARCTEAAVRAMRVAIRCGR